jgi:hypothetical protein
MPGGNRTGPMGMGPRTGRSAGYCAGFNMPGYANDIYGGGMRDGRGLGRGRGRGRAMFGGWRDMGGYRGRGFGRNLPNPYSDGLTYASGKEEAAALKNQADAMREDLEAIHARIKELESKTTQETTET